MYPIYRIGSVSVENTNMESILDISLGLTTRPTSTSALDVIWLLSTAAQIGGHSMHGIFSKKSPHPHPHSYPDLPHSCMSFLWASSAS